MPTISLIAAIDKNRAIGYKNKLLFHIADDLKRFKRLTIGHTIIMGRRTYESLPNGALPHRRNIVISSTLKSIDNAEVYRNIEEALRSVADDEEVFVIGGEMIYKQTIDMAHKLYLTIVDAYAPKADAWFPDFKSWHKQEETKHEGYLFAVYTK